MICTDGHDRDIDGDCWTTCPACTEETRMAHTCHATDCTNTVPPHLFMCRTHWYTLPRILRARIWATYRQGQEDDKQPSHEYCLAAKAAVVYIAAREGKTPDVKLYEIFDPGHDTPPRADTQPQPAQRLATPPGPAEGEDPPRS